MDTELFTNTLVACHASNQTLGGVAANMLVDMMTHIRPETVGRRGQGRHETGMKIY
jgi:hypothetical protein